MSNMQNSLIEATKSIASQVTGLDAEGINPEMQLFGEGSVFDSFAILLLLVELEQIADEDLLNGRSVVEWFQNFDFDGVGNMTLRKFASLLVDQFS